MNLYGHVESNLYGAQIKEEQLREIQVQLLPDYRLHGTRHIEGKTHIQARSEKRRTNLQVI